MTKMRSGVVLTGLVLSAVLSTACGGGGEEPSSEAPSAAVAAPAPSASASASTPAIVAQPPATTPPTTPTTPSTTASDCGAATLCLDVTSLRQGFKPHAGRVLVVWMPLAGGQPEIGYDAPFAGTETLLSIPLTGVTPPSDANAFCAKQGAACTGPVKLGFGIVAVVSDDNVDGKGALTEQAIGLSDVDLMYSQTALNPPPAGYVWAGKPMAQAFPSGVPQGTNAYTAPKGGFEELVPATAGAHFKLQVCDSTNGAECSVKAPF